VTSNTSPDTRRDRHFGPLIAKHDEIVSGVPTSVITRTIPGPGVAATRHGITGTWTFAFGEGRGNRFFTDQTGAFVQDVDYKPFGEVIAANSAGAQPGASTYTTAQWNGGDALAALGISQLGVRMYDPVIGRFLSRDPLLIPRTAATTNPYAFANNDPINSSDPIGLFTNPLRCESCTGGGNEGLEGGEYGPGGGGSEGGADSSPDQGFEATEYSPNNGVPPDPNPDTPLQPSGLSTPGASPTSGGGSGGGGGRGGSHGSRSGPQRGDPFLLGEEPQGGAGAPEGDEGDTIDDVERNGKGGSVVSTFVEVVAPHGSGVSAVARRVAGALDYMNIMIAAAKFRQNQSLATSVYWLGSAIADKYLLSAGPAGWAGFALKDGLEHPTHQFTDFHTSLANYWLFTRAINDFKDSMNDYEQAQLWNLDRQVFWAQYWREANAGLPAPPGTCVEDATCELVTAP
jgi:RHS repeat-associated protein